MGKGVFPFIFPFNFTMLHCNIHLIIVRQAMHTRVGEENVASDVISIIGEE